MRALLPLAAATAATARRRGPLDVAGAAPAWEIEDWTVKEHGESLYQHKNDKKPFLVNTTSYVSPTIKLMTGGAHFSLNPLTAIPFPSGDYTLLTAEFSMVNADTNQETSLAEVYNHHWLLGTADGLNVLEPCENNLFFGGGAEFRGMPQADDGVHGMIRIGSKGRCGGNLHFIRTEDLKTEWDGFNNPKGDYGAAVKNCIECGYAPGRAATCSEKDDGEFACCFTGSRCPVNNPSDKTKKGYRLTYTVSWTRDLTVRKPGGGGVLDIGNGAVEWNVAANLNNPAEGVNQICSDTVCNITAHYTVNRAGDFDQGGLCPGTMTGAYLHQHTGAISGTMFVNGKKHCSSFPKIGTVAGTGQDSVGNEKGYAVGFTNCVDQVNKNNAVRLNAGDVVTIEGLYDVDVNSKVNLPLPGGKHGGIMGLYFYGIDCDPGTFPTQYVCRQSTCIPVPKGDYDTADACDKACS